jgi:hypothetical protein
VAAEQQQLLLIMVIVEAEGEHLASVLWHPQVAEELELEDLLTLLLDLQMQQVEVKDLEVPLLEEMVELVLLTV